jgi:chromatin remodeling complex protein RSC6
MAVKRKKKKAAKAKKRPKKARRRVAAKGRKKTRKVKKTARKTVRRKKKGTRKKAAKKKGTRKKTAKKKGARKKVAKKKKRKGKKRKANPAFMKALRPSAALATVVGSAPLPRTQVVKKLWAYIKRNRLQDAKNRRMIIADAKLKPVFGGKSKVDMFKMTALVSKHLK